MQFDVLHSLKVLAVPVRHYDPRAYPDDSEWFRRFERYVVDASEQLRIAHARLDDGRGEVLLPLQLVQRASGYSVLESLDNYYTADYRPLCSTRESAELITPLFHRLLESDAPHQLWLRSVEPDTPETHAILYALRHFGWHVYVSPFQANWVHTLTGDYEHYLGSLSGRVQNTLKRKTKKLMSLPGMQLTVHQGLEDLEDALGAYQDIYAQSWKVPEAHPDFVPQLMRAEAAQGHLRLGILRQHDVPVAAHFWIVKEQTGFIYKLAHKKDFDNYSPGTVLLAQMISHTMKHDDVKQLDFMTGDDPYKADWMTERREKIQIVAYNPRSLKAQWVRLRDEYLKPAVKQFKMSKSKDSG